MPAERLSIRQIREVLRQKWVVGLRHRDVARSLGIEVGTVCRVLQWAQAAGLDWARVEALSDEALDRGVHRPGAGRRGGGAQPAALGAAPPARPDRQRLRALPGADRECRGPRPQRHGDLAQAGR